MKIIDNSVKNITLKDIENGKLFKVHNRIFMKVPCIDTKICGKINCVYIDSGDLGYTGENVSVVQVDAELIIK